MRTYKRFCVYQINKKSKTDISRTHPSIYPSGPEAAGRSDGMDRIELADAYREILKENIEYDRFFVENGYLEQVQGWGSGIHYQATEKGRENPAITNKLSNALMVRSAGYFERNFTQKAQKEQFGVSKDQKVPKGYAIHFNDGKNTYSKNRYNAEHSVTQANAVIGDDLKPFLNQALFRPFHHGSK